MGSYFDFTNNVHNTVDIVSAGKYGELFIYTKKLLCYNINLITINPNTCIWFVKNTLNICLLHMLVNNTVKKTHFRGSSVRTESSIKDLSRTDLELVCC